MMTWPAWLFRLEKKVIPMEMGKKLSNTKDEIHTRNIKT